MKAYDTIEYYGDYWGLPIIGFDKLDGSNLRFEYSKKRGFYKFGTRHMMIDDKHEDFGFAIKLFLDKYSDNLDKLFRSKNYRDILSFVCYAELHSPHSAFGRHNFNLNRDTYDITLFDVNEYKKGFIPPRRFVNDFQEYGIPRVVYEGNLNRELVKSVKSNEFGLVEGLICKGVTKTKKGNDQLYYCKIKTNDWFDRLRNKEPELYALEMKQVKEH